MCVCVCVCMCVCVCVRVCVREREKEKYLFLPCAKAVHTVFNDVLFFPFLRPLATVWPCLLFKY